MSSLPYASPREPQWKLALLLGGASALATLALLPYLAANLPPRPTSSHLPLWVLVLGPVVQTGVLCGLLAWAGLQLGARHALGAPWLRAWLYRTPAPTASSRWPMALALGAIVACLVIGIEAMGPRPPSPAIDAASQAWRGALATFYGGIVEETLFRLFLVSALVWLLAWTRGGEARPWMFVLAIVLAALLFGAGHLPAAFAMGIAQSPLGIGRIILLNALVGFLCGGLYWRLGLEHAMLAHFSFDIVLHGISPLLIG